MIYQIVDIRKIKREFFKEVMQENIGTCRKSLDGKLVVLKINDNPKNAELKRIFEKPLSHKEIKKLMHTKNWRQDVED